MPISKDDITIIIQGPLNKETTSRLDHYQQFGKVVYSHWLNDDINLLPPNSNSIANEPNIDQSVHNFQNVYKQLITTYAGIQLAKTPFIIKMRSDEYYENLLPILNTSSEEFITTINIFFRPDRYIKFHMSDHLFCCKTDLAQKAIELALKKCRNKDQYSKDNFICAEVLLTRSFLDILVGNYTNDQSIDLMRQYYKIIDASKELGQIRWKSNSEKIIGNNKTLSLLKNNISKIELL